MNRSSTINLMSFSFSEFPLIQFTISIDAVGDQLDEPTAVVDGYFSFFSFCKTKKQGYSGNINLNSIS